MNFNQTLLAGNLTRDPELKFTPKGTAIVNFSIAINRTWKGEDGQSKEDVTFCDITAFGRTAETIGHYFKRGMPIFLTGRLKTDVWDDKQTGQKRSKLGVVCESFQFVGSREDKSARSAGESAANQPERTPKPVSSDTPPPEDDVPF